MSRHSDDNGTDSDSDYVAGRVGADDDGESGTASASASDPATDMLSDSADSVQDLRRNRALGRAVGALGASNAFNMLVWTAACVTALTASVVVGLTLLSAASCPS
jgi:hypothetical protein